MKRVILTASALLLTTMALLAQRSVQDRIFKDGYRHNLSTMVEFFDHEMPGSYFAEWYAYEDIDGDVICELLLADHNKERVIAFKYEGDDVSQVPVGSTEGVDWKYLFWSFSEMYDESMLDESDVTLRYRPIFADNVDIAANKFKATSEERFSDLKHVMDNKRRSSSRRK